MPLRMYDTASLSYQGGIPADAPAIAFYIDGLYKNDGAARARFPHLFALGRTVGLTVLGRIPATGDDFEPGNWRGDAGAWAKAAIAAGIWRPVIYADLSDMQASVIPELEAHFGALPPPGPRRPVRLWLAHPNGVEQIPADMDAVQYWWGSIQGGGRVDMDISSVRDDFFHKGPPPGPSPLPIKEADVIVVSRMKDGRAELFVEKADTGEVFHTWQQKPDQGGGWVGAQADKRNAWWYSLGVPGHQK